MSVEKSGCSVRLTRGASLSRLFHAQINVSLPEILPSAEVENEPPCCLISSAQNGEQILRAHGTSSSWRKWRYEQPQTQEWFPSCLLRSARQAHRRSIKAMKQSFVQCAEVLLQPDADTAGPGGAVTLRLCGSWDHPGPCRWPHHTAADWNGLHGKVRVVFTASAEEEAEVRLLITRALAGGECAGPDGRSSRWTATVQGHGTLSEEEEALSANWGSAS